MGVCGRHKSAGSLDGEPEDIGENPDCVWGMSLVCREDGYRRKLTSRFTQALASTAIVATLAAGLWAGFGSPAMSGGETRTISLHHVHTGESLTVTYMVNGRYVPSAMKQINYLLRDWRRNEVIAIDPKTVDLVWELHADLGSKAPINIICGYRSAKTNSFLKRIGRGVARKSQHIAGKAIDIAFPDVPTIKMRNSALVRKVGGVGYYTGRNSFLHVDSGSVRQWGPGISANEMASIFRDYRRTVGARLNRNDQLRVASAKFTVPAQKAKTPPVEAGYEGDDDELAQMTEIASKTPAKPKAKLVPEVAAAPETVAQLVVIPKPRPKPIEVLMMAAVNMKIEPASAPPPDEDQAQSPVADSIGAIAAASTMAEESIGMVSSNISAKGGLADSLRDDTASGVPVIRTLTASAAGQDIFWWPQQITFDVARAIRRDGAPQPFADTAAGLLPGGAEAAEVTALPKLAIATMQEVASGKGDMLVVNRDGKGSLEMGQTFRLKPQELGQLETP